MKAATLGLLLGLTGGAPPETEAWLFFSPDSPGAAGMLGELRGIPVHPVLVTERFFGRTGPRPEFLATLRAIGETRVIDEEGLALAKRLDVRELPALALRHGRSWHLASGNGLRVKELLACRH